jgi:CheY-like chemotaxis protein
MAGGRSEFVVQLPLNESSTSSNRIPLDPSVTHLTDQRVLVVDDTRDAAVSLGQLLQLLGVPVRVTHDGPSALEMLESYRPSVVLLDIGMPGMDGYEVARRIRRRPAGRDVTLIAQTGCGQEEDRHRTRNAGFDHHLLKPANINALRSILLSLHG